MKKSSSLFLILLFSLGCKAQNPVLNISEDRGTKNLSGAYYKDLYNLLNNFEGTYLYTNGNTSFKIVLQKKLMSAINNNRYYHDLLIGEYQYIENGAEKVNTLAKLNANYSDKRNHSISTNHIITNGDIGCIDCLPNEKALMAGLVDGASENTAQLTIRRVIVNNQPAIKIFILWRMTQRSENTPASPHASIPGGSYTLIKQP